MNCWAIYFTDGVTITSLQLHFLGLHNLDRLSVKMHVYHVTTYNWDFLKQKSVKVKLLLTY